MRSSPPTRRTVLAALAASIATPRRALAQSAAAAPVAAAPVLEGLAPDELEALRPLARRGAALLVRDADQGARARITVLARARAPLETVRAVIMAPERYGEFMPGVGAMEILSRRGNRIGLRFRTAMGVFDVTTLASLHQVSPQRVDGALLQSDLGPGGLRWDLYPDGDGTLVGYSTWGDPTQGNWFLRLVARLSVAAIAGMQISYDVLLALAAARRAEILAGLQLPARPPAAVAQVPAGDVAPPPPGPWTDLTRRAVVGAIVLDDAGSFRVATVAVRTNASADAVCARLFHVAGYGAIWHPIRTLRVVSDTPAGVRYFSAVDTPIFHTEGEQTRVVARGPYGHLVWWRGETGDYADDAQRWDLLQDPAGGSVMLFTGKSEQNRAGMIARALLSRDPWLTPGYAAAWKMIWMRPLQVRL